MIKCLVTAAVVLLSLVSMDGYTQSSSESPQNSNSAGVETNRQWAIDKVYGEEKRKQAAQDAVREANELIYKFLLAQYIDTECADVAKEHLDRYGTPQINESIGPEYKSEWWRWEGVSLNLITTGDDCTWMIHR